MRTSTRIRIASVLTGLTLATGGAAFAAPAAQAAAHASAPASAHTDVSACINRAERELKGGEAPEGVRASCYVALTGAQDACVTGLTQSGVTHATAVTACKEADQ
ncbi:hypothetical protein OHS33_26940 [Streptomyces sp. NBC_00536]|uniref:hypothetical protein n=1 Tax=Streptomyces sp. NBC_00536 TaxID=2975769 RepID=UPI002E816E14|nr:hypothetical protein [Streptomyces sp. NBC_00536]WUC81650.1 hypothetical protein OHS33_26940 [Streptomyces sp. NBC_00536]